MGQLREVAAPVLEHALVRRGASVLDEVVELSHGDPIGRALLAQRDVLGVEKALLDGPTQRGRRESSVLRRLLDREPQVRPVISRALLRSTAYAVSDLPQDVATLLEDLDQFLRSFHQHAHISTRLAAKKDSAAARPCRPLIVSERT